jgi:hypothetical protein
MSKSKLLIAISAGVFAATAATGAFAQTSSGNSAAGMGNMSQQDQSMGNDTTTTTQSGTMSKHKMHKHSAHTGAKKTPEAETGNNANSEGGQSH